MRRLVVAIVVVAFSGILSLNVAAQTSAPFHSLRFSDRREYIVQCAATYECDIQLQAGERVNDGFNAHIDQWDPHIGYSGVDKVTPHLVLRPSVPNLRTNIILTTTKRTYYILAISTSRNQPSYYTFSYQDETFRELRRISLATQAALRAVREQTGPQATPTPADVATLGSACVDYDYSYAVERSVQPDHAHFARPSREPLPDYLIPRVVCTDGKHTYIEFPRQQEVPADLPISLAVTAEGDTLIDYTYVEALNRFTIDGVYDTFVLEVGSQNAPLRLRIYHAGRGNPPQNPKPIRINPPRDLNLIDRPVVPMETPLLPTPQPLSTLLSTPQPLQTALPTPVSAPSSAAIVAPTPGDN